MKKSRIIFQSFTLVAFTVIGLCLSVNEAMAQDPEFSQFYANQLYLNPAFAGTRRCPRINLNYRNQWPNIPKSAGSSTYSTFSASYDKHIDAISGGIGIIATNDRAGGNTINTTNVAAIYSYQLNVNRNFSIRAGFKAGVFQKYLDWNKLTFGDMVDPRYGFIYQTNEIKPNKTSSTNVDFSAGLLGFSKQFYFGIAVDHLTQPDESLIGGSSPLPRKYTIHGGAVIPFDKRHKDKGSISPNVLIRYQRAGDAAAMQLNLGMYVTKGPMVGGLWFRNGDSFIILLGFQGDTYKFGYSYDITINKLNNTNTAGAHELSLGMNFDCRPKRRKFRQISCPSF